MDPTGKQFPAKPPVDGVDQPASHAAEPDRRSVGTSRAHDVTKAMTPGTQPAPAARTVTGPAPVAFGRYQVRSAGIGGFGTVYLGHDSELDRPVAIKVLRGGTDVAAAETDRFLEEARRLARLRIPAS